MINNAPAPLSDAQKETLRHAIKFGLDKFADITWGFPIEIETDCQVVHDIIFASMISKPHVRWRDGIIAHNIAAV